MTFVCRLPVDETLTINGETYAGAASDFMTLSLLGEGVRGTVYKCRHRPSKYIVAVKVSQLAIRLHRRDCVLFS